jgi:hypothetical protein
MQKIKDGHAPAAREDGAFFARSLEALGTMRRDFRAIALTLTRRHGIGKSLSAPLSPIELAEEISRQIAAREAEGKEVLGECKLGEEILIALAELHGLLKIYERPRSREQEAGTVAQLILTAHKLGEYEGKRKILYQIALPGGLGDTAVQAAESSRKNREHGKQGAETKKWWWSIAERRWIELWRRWPNKKARGCKAMIDHQVFQYIESIANGRPIPDRLSTITRTRQKQKWIKGA